MQKNDDGRATLLLSGEAELAGKQLTWGLASLCLVSLDPPLCGVLALTRQDGSGSGKKIHGGH